MKTDNVLLVELAGLGPVLTVNNRLAATLISRCDQQYRLQGHNCWRRPEILPLNAWLAVQVESLDLTPRLLNDHQVRRLWEEIIEEDIARRDAPGLLQVPSSAETACKAHQLLIQYGGRIESYPQSQDVAAFVRWLEAWNVKCRAGSWLTFAEIPALVTDAFVKGQLGVPSHLTLAGFDVLPPNLEALVDVVRSKGGQVTLFAEDEAPASKFIRCRAADPAEEVAQCARWVRSELEQTPMSRIGVVAPSLEGYLPLLRSVLQSELCPGQALDLDAGHPAEFSLGSSLSDEGPVHLALSLLGLGTRIELAEAGWLLRSPFLGYAKAETTARVLADLELRQKGQSVLALPRLIKIIDKLGKLPRFVAILRSLQGWVSDRRKRRPGLWSEQMASLLEEVGWPGDFGLSSRDYQLVEKFNSLLHQLASLDLVSNPISRSGAVGLLRRMAQVTEFQIEETPSNLQVLGFLESSGQEFDSLWVMGMHDGACPVPARPNPFLPLEMQKDLGMPHADAVRELEFARHSCSRLFAAANRVVVSWPASIDGAECRPSPLLSQLADVSPEIANVCSPRHLLIGSAELESFVDRKGPGLPAGVPFKGGTGILKDQALCPFRAYAHFRLLARGMDIPDIGIDPMSRGTLVHGVLELFWKQVRTSRSLQELTVPELEGLLSMAAEQALASFEREKRLDLPSRQRHIERERLQRVASTWLGKEGERDPFEVIEIEKSRSMTIGTLSIRTRIDRIDQLENGRKLVIDYKTGKPDVGHWYDERVTEPQLPIYCTSLAAEEVGGALFARVHCRPGENGFYGLLHPDCGWSEKWNRELNKILQQHGWEHFSDIVSHWQKSLERLATEFITGKADVDPIEGEKTCRFCDLLPFCRRFELEPDPGEVTVD